MIACMDAFKAFCCVIYWESLEGGVELAIILAGRAKNPANHREARTSLHSMHSIILRQCQTDPTTTATTRESIITLLEETTPLDRPIIVSA